MTRDTRRTVVFLALLLLYVVVFVVAFVLVAAAQRTGSGNPAAPCLDKGGDIYWANVNGHLVCRAPR